MLHGCELDRHQSLHATVEAEGVGSVIVVGCAEVVISGAAKKGRNCIFVCSHACMH